MDDNERMERLERSLAVFVAHLATIERDEQLGEFEAEIETADIDLGDFEEVDE